MPRTHGQRQPDFGNLRARKVREDEGPRTPSASPAARAIARREREDKTRPMPLLSAARHEAEMSVKAELYEFLLGLALGDQFQASDFTAHLQAVGAIPDKGVLDLRCTGGWFTSLASSGVLTRAGYRQNAGCSERNYNATPRMVYTLARYPERSEL